MLNATRLGRSTCRPRRSVNSQSEYLASLSPDKLAEALALMKVLQEQDIRLGMEYVGTKTIWSICNIELVQVNPRVGRQATDALAAIIRATRALPMRNLTNFHAVLSACICGRGVT